MEGAGSAEVARWATELAAELAAGGQDAFADVYLATAERVWRRARRAVGSAEADDAVSLVYLEVWRLRHKAVAVDGSVHPWVLAVAENCFSSYRRTRRRHEARLARCAAHTAIVSSSRIDSAHDDHAKQVVAALDAQAQTATFLQALGELPDPQQHIARRCLVDGATSAEVAAELGSNASTVRGQLALARRALVAALGRTGGVPDTPAGRGHLTDDRRAAPVRGRLTQAEA
ncbi:MAG: RNA polymerase sigma factor [Janthinobacterium lividum]